MLDAAAAVPAPCWRGDPVSGDQVLVEHRIVAAYTRLDVEALGPLATVLRAVLRAAVDGDLDRAAAALAALIAALPVTHPLTVAARTGLDVGDARRRYLRQQGEVSHSIAAAPFWRGYSARWLPHDVVQHRRAQPGPLARDGRGAA